MNRRRRGDRGRGPRRPDRRRLRLPLVIGTLLLLAVVAVQAYQAYAGAGGPVNVLLLGVDREETRTDVVILARWDPASRSLSLISLPRDLRVEIPCPSDPPDPSDPSGPPDPGTRICRTPDKLAHVHAYGVPGDQGPQLAMKTVSHYLGVPVHHYVRVNFAGFVALVDALGGVAVDVEQPMDYDDPYQDLHIHLQPGRQVLTGEEALQYVRFRSDGQGDLGRIARTQQFFRALLAALAHQENLHRLPELVQTVYRHVDTDLNPQSAVALTRGLREALNEPGSVLKTYTIPGEPRLIEGLWFWEGDPAAVRTIVGEVFGR